MRSQRSSEELAKAAEHLLYEYWMLMAVARGMASGMSGQGWLTNALLESFVIHFRALLDFFYPPAGAKPDDVLSTDFFRDPSEWEQARPALPEALRQGKLRAHKEIAHLTYARQAVAPEAKAWAFMEIATEMEKLMRLFQKAAKLEHAEGSGSGA